MVAPSWMKKFPDSGLSSFAHVLADEVNCLKRNTLQALTGIIPQFKAGKRVDFIDSNHDELPLVVIDSDPLASARRTWQCHVAVIISRPHAVWTILSAAMIAGSK
jgi:hypothetical protein